MEDLDQSPDDSFERDVVCETEDSFLLSTENMKALRTLHDKVGDDFPWSTGILYEVSFERKQSSSLITHSIRDHFGDPNLNFATEYHMSGNNWELNDLVVNHGVSNTL